MWTVSQTGWIEPAEPVRRGLCRFGEVVPDVLAKYGLEPNSSHSADRPQLGWCEFADCHEPELAAV
jgi:hypothetical protein